MGTALGGSTVTGPGTPEPQISLAGRQAGGHVCVTGSKVLLGLAWECFPGGSEGSRWQVRGSPASHRARPHPGGLHTQSSDGSPWPEIPVWIFSSFAHAPIHPFTNIQQMPRLGLGFCHATNPGVALPSLSQRSSVDTTRKHGSSYNGSEAQPRVCSQNSTSPQAGDNQDRPCTVQRFGG